VAQQMVVPFADRAKSRLIQIRCVS